MKYTINIEAIYSGKFFKKIIISLKYNNIFFLERFERIKIKDKISKINKINKISKKQNK